MADDQLLKSRDTWRELYEAERAARIEAESRALYLKRERAKEYVQFAKWNAEWQRRALLAEVALQPFAEHYGWARKSDWPAAIADDDTTPVVGREDVTGEESSHALYVGDFRRAYEIVASVSEPKMTEPRG